MSLRHRIRRILTALALILGMAGAAYSLWSPGERIQDGRHDRGENGIWLQHGWLGDDLWFKENQRNPEDFRNPSKIHELAGRLRSHGIRYVFPHLCPSGPRGDIAKADPHQIERFLDGFSGISVLPWIGGVRDLNAYPESEPWRQRFVASTVSLLQDHPRLAGVHLNIEPMPDGNRAFLLLLDELRASLPPGKILSIAAYPPPTRWHPFPEVHWSEGYYREVSARSDQLVPMLYDTGLRWQKPYRRLVSDWTREVVAWSGKKPVLLGIPAYDDASSGYHDPDVENLPNALMGIHAGLSADDLPSNYVGVCLYSEWEMSGEDWKLLSHEFHQSR